MSADPRIDYIVTTQSPADVLANTTAEQTLTVSQCAGGQPLSPGDIIFVNKPTAQAGLGIVGARVISATTVGITFSNNTGSTITPTASQVYRIGVLRAQP